MGLKTTFQNSVEAIFTSLDDLIVTATYTEVGDTITFNPVTGLHSTSDTYEYLTATDSSYVTDTLGASIDMTGVTDSSANTHTVYVIPIDYETKNIDNEIIHSTDKQFLMKAKNITFTPKPNDLVTISSMDWTVRNVEVDPADALWILQVRP